MAQLILLLDLAEEKDTSLAGQLVLSGFGLRTAVDFAGAGRTARREGAAAALVRLDASVTQLERGFAALDGLPALALCVERDTDLVVRCLEAGADSALSAPVTRRELAARLQALVRSQYGGGVVDLLPQFAPQRVGDLLVDPGSHTVSQNGYSVALTPTEFRLLLALARRQGEVASHEELLSEVWGASCDDGHEKLRLYVRYLRRKLRDEDAPRLLLNERGVGYRLVSAGRNGNGHGP